MNLNFFNLSKFTNNERKIYKVFTRNLRLQSVPNIKSKVSRMQEIMTNKMLQ